MARTHQSVASAHERASASDTPQPVWSVDAWFDSLGRRAVPAPGKEAAEPVRCRKTTGRADSAAGRARPRRRLPPPGRVLSLARIRSRSAGSGAPPGTGRRGRSTATLTATGDRSVAPRNAELTCRACTAYGVPAEMCSGKLRSVSGSVFHRPGPRIVNN